MEGILIVDKPAGFTSFDVIAKLRGILKTKKMGHGGTLDPMATGVLPVFIGGATRAVDFIPRDDKQYIATVKLGVATDSGDLDGTVTATSDARCTAADLLSAIPSFLGPQVQVPPMVSAVKVNGRRLYDLAREGQTVERTPREIEIHNIALLSFNAQAGEFEMQVRCSRGTYIRVLGEELARAVGCLGALSALRRTESAGFTLADAHTLAQIEQAGEAARAWLRPVDTVFECYDAVRLDGELTRFFLNGVAFDYRQTRQGVMPETEYRIYGGDGAFLGLARREGDLLKKTRHFFSQQPQNSIDRKPEQ